MSQQLLEQCCRGWSAVGRQDLSNPSLGLAGGAGATREGTTSSSASFSPFHRCKPSAVCQALRFSTKALSLLTFQKCSKKQDELVRKTLWSSTHPPHSKPKSEKAKSVQSVHPAYPPLLQDSFKAASALLPCLVCSGSPRWALLAGMQFVPLCMPSEGSEPLRARRGMGMHRGTEGSGGSLLGDHPTRLYTVQVTP